MRTRRRARCSVGAGLRVAGPVLRLTVAPPLFTARWTWRARVSRIAPRTLREGCGLDQRMNGVGLELQPFPALDRRRHRDDAVARADQAADHHPQRLEQT